MAKRILKLGVKASILTGAVYFTIDQGLWEETDKADQVYAELRRAVSPYIGEVPIEVPDMPSTSEVVEVSRFSYNRGVVASVGFLRDLPSTACSWMSSIQSTFSQMMEAPPAEVQSDPSSSSSKST